MSKFSNPMILVKILSMFALVTGLVLEHNLKPARQVNLPDYRYTLMKFFYNHIAQ